MGLLPISTFANGHVYYSQGLSDMLNVTPYVIHNTFQFSGTPGKRHRYREKLLWLVVRAAFSCFALATQGFQFHHHPMMQRNSLLE